MTYTVKPQTAIVQDKYRGWWHIGDPRAADSVTNHFTTLLRETGFRAITFPRPVKLQWDHKNPCSLRFKSACKKTGLGGEKHWFCSPSAHDHIYRYSCWTPLIAALNTIKSTVFLQSRTLKQKRHSSKTDSLAWGPHIGRSYKEVPDWQTGQVPRPSTWGNSHIRSASPKIVRRCAPRYFKILFFPLSIYVYYSFQRPLIC